MLRQDYNQIMAAYKKVAKGNARLTQSDLVLIRAIDPSTTNYRFPVLENEAAIVYPEEIRLNINDQFALTHMGVYLGARLATEAELIPKGPLQIYPYAPFEQEAVKMLPLKHLYTGYLKVDVNNVNFVDKWALRKHEFVPQTQFKQFESASPFTTQANIDYKSDGIFPVCPNIIFSGAKKNDVQIFLPNAMASGEFSMNTNGTQPVPDKVYVRFMYIVVVLRGFLAQNAAKFQG